MAVTLVGGLAPPSEGGREGGLARIPDFCLPPPASWRVQVQREAHALRTEHAMKKVFHWGDWRFERVATRDCAYLTELARVVYLYEPGQHTRGQTTA